MKHLERFVWGILMLLALMLVAGLLVGTILGVAHYPKFAMPVFLLVVAYLLGLIKTKFDDGTIK